MSITEDDACKDCFVKARTRKEKRSERTNRTDKTADFPPLPKPKSSITKRTPSTTVIQPVAALSATSKALTSVGDTNAASQPATTSLTAGLEQVLPRSEDDYRKILHLFKEEVVPHYTLPLPSERNIHAVINGLSTTLSEPEIKEEL
nr:unnamed protein product [Callosobruchus chinensis]